MSGRGGASPKKAAGRGESRLPVDPERLRRQFPSLTDEDLVAYVEVTRRILAERAARPQIVRRLMAAAEAAGVKKSAGTALTSEEAMALAYATALDKMQRPVTGRG